jgi:hypothetical protein
MDPETTAFDVPQGRAAARRSARFDASWASPCLAVVLFLLIWIDARGRDTVDGSKEYHDRVRDVANESLKSSVGDWLGRVVAAPRAVVALLKANVITSREYSNLRTGESATVLFVHCGDARDLLGHFPPVCYPAHGQALKSSAIKDWTIDGVTITGMRYRFEGREGPMAPENVVDNFMVLSDGSFGRDMDAATRVARDRRLRRFGAAEVQVVTDASMSDQRRDEVFRELMTSALPLFECIRKEVKGD